jgi:neutral ceramidase
MLRFGPLAVAAFPAEITTQAGRRIKAAVQAKAGTNAPEGAIIAGLTNSYASYTATPEEYDACYYEGSFTLWGRRQAAKYRDLAADLAANMYAGGPAVASGPEPPQVSPGTPQSPTVRQTPNAGDVVEQPKDVQRLQRVVFRWRAGDQTVDPGRGRAFVTLQRRVGSSFVDVATEDSLYDTTEVHGDTQGNEVWTHTFEFHECVPLGTYRFVVRGRADKGGGVQPYTVRSKTFEVRRSTGIKTYSKKVDGTTARVRAEYSGFAAQPLTGLPLRVRSGFAIVRVHAPGGAVNDVIAPIDPKGLEFDARVPAGSTIDVVSIEDACGNTGS